MGSDLPPVLLVGTCYYTIDLEPVFQIEPGLLEYSNSVSK